jgi:phosphoribosylformylglycinamidine synthase I
MSIPKVIILTGYGINCEEETAFAFEKSGANSIIIHINDLIENKAILNDSQIFVFPGGFSYGDDTGSGKALANKIKNNIIDELESFISRDTLMLGICNGFQVMVNLGIVPALGGFTKKAQVSLEHNVSSIYQCRWIDIEVNSKSPSVFTKGISRLHIPVAHGEGNFFAPPATIDSIMKKNLCVMKYVKPDGSHAQGDFPFNPNGSMNDIASICDESGRVMGMMPHPERGMFFTQRDDWTSLKEEYLRNGKSIPEESDGMMIFKNAVKYFV